METARKFYEAILREEEELGVRVLAHSENEFPPTFTANITPERLPALLYLRGRELPEETSCVALVGTRKPTSLGVDAARNFGAYFTGQKLSVVSGLARGIDTMAHKENLKVGTISVLGSGVGSVYPKENQSLAEEILAAGGALLSPFPLYQIPLPQNFPARNELIAAMACGTVVIEGAEQSGAAITGHQALSMSKTVVVLSQDYRTTFGKGAIKLQQSGAVMVASEEEALQAIFAPHGGFQSQNEFSPKVRRKIFQFSDFQKATGKSNNEAAAMIEEAILRGRIERVDPQRYRFTRANKA
ncbi:MAG: DNA-processing protein DprA [Bdellovibrionota bacterium]